MPLSPQRLGTWLIIASTLPFASAGLFTRLTEADIWSVLGWRGVIGGALLWLYAAHMDRGRAMGWQGWVLALTGAAASAAFLSAFRLTSVANVALIYTLAPFVAAALDRMLFAHPIPRPVMIAAVISAVGVGFVMQGGGGGSNLMGDLLALVMTALMALATVLIRAWPDAPSLKAQTAAGVPLILVAFAFGQPLQVGGPDAVVLIAFGASFALAGLLLIEGARRLPAPQVALYGGLETPVAIALAGLILGEWPGPLTYLGGAIILCAVIGLAVLAPSTTPE